MDAINIFCGIVLFVSMASNLTGAKKGLKSSISQHKEKPKSYLQKYPVNISAIILVIIIVGIFNIGTIKLDEKYSMYRLIGLILYAISSYMQVFSYKTLGENYSQEVVILKNHKLITTKVYKLVRHPQYFFQIISDLSVGIALVSYIVVPLVLLVELPLFILRAKLEEKLLLKHFGNEYVLYKSKSGFFVPFIG